MKNVKTVGTILIIIAGLAFLSFIFSIIGIKEKADLRAKLELKEERIVELEEERANLKGTIWDLNQSLLQEVEKDEK